MFTTHTPVEAGHDRFNYDDAVRVLGDFIELDQLKLLAGSDKLNMTHLALKLSGYINGVARRQRKQPDSLFWFPDPLDHKRCSPRSLGASGNGGVVRWHLPGVAV